MPNPIFWKKKLLLAKIESSEGVDPTPTGAANAIVASDIKLTPMDGDDESRNIERPYLGAQEMIPVGLTTRIQFKIEMAGSGTAGVAPAWGPLARACRCQQVIVADTSVAYVPITDSQESITLYIWHGRTKQIMKGCRGTVKLRFTAQKIPYLEFDLIGLYAEPTEADQLVPTYTGFKKPKVVSKTNTPTFTVDSVALVLRELVLDLGNKVEPRMLVGSERIIIPDGEESLSMRVEAVPLSTFNPFSAALDDPVPVVLVHGTVAGNIATLEVDLAQIRRLSGYEQQQNTLEWPLEATPMPGSGNDQWSLTLT